MTDGKIITDRNAKARAEAPHTSLGHAFKHHDAEIGVKLSAALKMWYDAINETQIAPVERKCIQLEQRIAWLEMWPWERAYYTVVHQLVVLRTWWRARGEEAPAAAEPVPEPNMDEAAPVTGLASMVDPALEQTLP